MGATRQRGLWRCAGTQFDRAVIDAFAAITEDELALGGELTVLV